MPREDLIDVNGTILSALGGGQYEIQPETGNAVLKAKLSGKMKQNHIRVIPGDKVTVGVSPYDMTHGIITRRLRA